MKIRSYLMLMAAVIFVPITVFSLIGLQNLLDRERQTRREAIEESARATALAIDLEIAKAQGALGVLANSVHIQAEDLQALYALMKKGTPTANSWTVLFDYEGNVKVNTLVPFRTQFDPIGYTWVRNVIDSQKMTVSNVRIGKVSKVPVVSVNVPIPSETGKKYALSHIFRADHFNQFLSSPNISPTWLVTVYGSDGVNIARNRRYSERVGKPVPSAVYQASLRQVQGRLRYVTSENVEVYSAFTRSQRTGWTVSIGVPVSEIEDAARRAVWITATVIGSIFALVLALIFLLARRLTQSVETVVYAAKKLAQGVTPDVQPSKVSELDVLQRALHDAGEALSTENKARLELEADRERLLVSEKQARQQAENQNRSKDDFLAMLAHELRNPLAPISTAAQLLKLSGGSEKLVKRSSDIIARQVTHMTELINDLLDVSRVTRGLVTLEKDHIDMREVVEHALEQTAPIIQYRKHQLNISMPSVPACVYGDHTRLVQVISNLVNNAAKYTQQEGHITVTVEIHAGQVRVNVRDNGSGIEPALLPNVFDVFTQGVRTSDRSQGGLGLGLTLVKKIVSLHGGQVEAASDGPGKGSTFSLVLPAVSKNPVNETRKDESRQAVQVGPVKALSLMIVDDNRDAAETLAAFLEAQGHEVTVEVDPGSAINVATLHPPQVFILDIGLPGMDGYELARKLRSNIATKNAVFIALTGYGQEHDKILSKAAGFDHHFVKPINIEQLQKILFQVVSNCID